MYTKKEIASRIDHTLLKPDASREQIKKLCAEAVEYGFASVCVNASRAALAKSLIEGSGVRLCVVIGFPLGACTGEVKAFEAARMAQLGADELDMVINIGAAKDGDWELVRGEIEQVRAACPGKTLKVIIETCLLTDGEKAAACEAARLAGADFVKTSTGFSTGGATEQDVLLMKKASGGLLVKASGGVRSFDDAAAMLAAGADRLGASAGIAIVSDERLAN